jgi:DNA invertase Pin-like site-specific DNA recombinase
MNKDQIDQIAKKLEEGITPKEIAEAFGIHYVTLKRRLADSGYRITHTLAPIVPVGMEASR